MTTTEYRKRVNELIDEIKKYGKVKKGVKVLSKDEIVEIVSHLTKIEIGVENGNKKLTKFYIDKIIDINMNQDFGLDNFETTDIVCSKILKKVKVDGNLIKSNWRMSAELVLTENGIFINSPRRNNWNIGVCEYYVINKWRDTYWIDDIRYIKTKDGVW
jgi:hypothetical protein